MRKLGIEVGVIKTSVTTENSVLAVGDANITRGLCVRRLTEHAEDDGVVCVHVLLQSLELVEELFTFNVNSSLLLKGCVVGVDEFILH